MSAPRQFRFRPRFGVLAWSAIGVAAALAMAAIALGWSADAQWTAFIAAGVGATLGALYLLSPAWRYVAVVDDDGVEVVDHHGDRKFRVAWAEVQVLYASPSTRTCTLIGGGPERTLIVPGVGNPAPYDIENKAALYAEIVNRTPRDVVTELELVEQARTDVSVPSPK